MDCRCRCVWCSASHGSIGTRAGSPSKFSQHRAGALQLPRPRPRVCTCMRYIAELYHVTNHQRQEAGSHVADTCSPGALYQLQPIHSRPCPTCSRSTACGGSSHTTCTCRQLLEQRARQLYEEAWSNGRVLLLTTIMAEDHEQHDVVWQQQPGVGRKRMVRGILAYRAAYPDIKFVIESLAAAPDKPEVFVAWTASGTNSGPIREQPPTGKAVSFQGLSRLCFNTEGQIQASYVFRQAPADEMRYFLAQGGPAASS